MADPAEHIYFVHTVQENPDLFIQLRREHLQPSTVLLNILWSRFEEILDKSEEIYEREILFRKKKKTDQTGFKST